MASPTTDSASFEQKIDESAVRKANLAPSNAVAVDVDPDSPEELNKPPLLKHV